MADRLLDASQQGDLQTVRELIEGKVDPNKVVEQRPYNPRINRYVRGWTPLHYASL